MVYMKLLIAALAIKLAGSQSAENAADADEHIDPIEVGRVCQLPSTPNEKIPVLLLHDLGKCREDLLDLLYTIASETKRKVCYFDLRNHGDSAWNNRSDVEALAVDVRNVLDMEHMQKVNLIGHGLGGKTAIHFALKNPDRVASIITEDVRPNSVPPEALQTMIDMLRFLKAGLESVPEGKSATLAQWFIKRYVNEELRKVGSVDLITDAAEENIGLIPDFGKWRFKFNIDLFEQALKEDVYSFWTPSTGYYDGPALFVYGTKSPFQVYQDRGFILELFPYAEFLAVEDAGHRIHEKFHQFNDAVIRFLNKLH